MLLRSLEHLALIPIEKSECVYDLCRIYNMAMRNVCDNLSYSIVMRINIRKQYIYHK